MLDIRYIRENKKLVIELLEKRNKPFENVINELLENDEKRRNIIKNVEVLKALRNETSKKIGLYKREGKDPKEIMEKIGSIGSEIKDYDDQLRDLEDKIKNSLLWIPNLPKEDSVVGKDDSENKELRKVGVPKSFPFKAKAHWDIAEDLDILDFERAGKITGSRFVVYKGLGARLERALIAFMMDLHSIENGYTELLPPLIVNRDSMFATGQFPKFQEDAFEIVDDRGFYLNPTAEVPTINYHRDETLEGNKLPIKFCSYTTAFRQEAGSAGRDTRGILRQHQFNKVELIKFTKPENSYDELDKMLADSESVLKKLEIPYRVVELCTGDLGFSMRKTYDIEVWLPSYETYREIGSISNAEDYQARRGNIKFKRDKESKPEFVHTLNGSGLAVGRTVIAILENYQQEDGSVRIPKALIPYMKVEVIK